MGRKTYIDFVKKYWYEHPRLSWIEAMEKASPSYRKLHGGLLVGGARKRRSGSKSVKRRPRRGGIYAGGIVDRKSALLGWKHRRSHGRSKVRSVIKRDRSKGSRSIESILRRYL